MVTKNNRAFNLIANIFMCLYALCCLIPLVLLVIASFTDNSTLIRDGYSFFPKKFSLDAYKYLIDSSGQILRAYGMSFIVTIIGTSASLVITTMLAYTISKKDLPFRGILTIFVFFTMLFNGGLVPTYLMYTGTFHIKNTIWALIIPGMLLSAYYVMLC